MSNFPVCGCAAHVTKEKIDVVNTSVFIALSLFMLEHRGTALAMLPTPDLPVDGALCSLLWKSNCQATPDISKAAARVTFPRCTSWITVPQDVISCITKGKKGAGSIFFSLATSIPHTLTLNLHDNSSKELK